MVKFTLLCTFGSLMDFGRKGWLNQPRDFFKGLVSPLCQLSTGLVIPGQQKLGKTG
jgi:hypothetical protein